MSHRKNGHRVEKMYTRHVPSAQPAMQSLGGEAGGPVPLDALLKRIPGSFDRRKRISQGEDALWNFVQRNLTGTLIGSLVTGMLLAAWLSRPQRN